MKTKICLELKDINFHFNKHPILENISFSVDIGDYVGIIGPNGGGKTTLLKIILGLLKPASGEVEIFGQNIETFKERYQLGYVPQRATHGEFFFPATVEEVVRSGRIARIGLFRRFRTEDIQAVKRAMEIADVAQYGNRLIGRLSGGELQRVLIARALAGEPKVLILDEPEVGVDIASKEKFYSFLTHLNQEFRITIIYVSHDVAAIAHEVSNIICLNRCLICHGAPEDYIKEDFLEKVYGRKVTSVLHKH
jgi:zinc transport system ATP-binding protein